MSSRGRLLSLPIGDKQARQLLQDLLGNAALNGWTFVVAVPPPQHVSPRDQVRRRPSGPASVDTFLAHWAGGLLAVPFGLCTTAQLHAAYLATTPPGGEEPASQNVLSSFAAALPGIVLRRFQARLPGAALKQFRCVAPEACTAPPDGWVGRQVDWVSHQLEQFESGLGQLRSGRKSSARPVTR
jgi:hypothetical protein